MGIFGPSMSNSPSGGYGPKPIPQPARESFYLLPQQPQPREVASTLEHLTGRPADPAEVRGLLDRLDVTYGDYAPGGETGPGNAGGETGIR